MKQYNIGTKEIYEQMYSVNADSKDEAIAKLKQYLTDSSYEEDVFLLEDQIEYCNSLGDDTWNVYEAEDMEHV